MVLFSDVIGTHYRLNTILPIHAIKKPPRVLPTEYGQLLLQNTDDIGFIFLLELEIIDRVVVVHREYKLVLRGDRKDSLEVIKIAQFSEAPQGNGSCMSVSSSGAYDRGIDGRMTFGIVDDIFVVETKAIIKFSRRTICFALSCERIEVHSVVRRKLFGLRTLIVYVLEVSTARSS